MKNENDLVCTSCRNIVKDDSEYCIFCGTIFIEGINCNNHPDIGAEGVCLICESAFCSDCGKFYNSKFLCNTHCEYQIYENMARIYGSSDALEIQYLKDILQNEGLHPFIYSMKTNPLFFGNSDYSLFEASGESNRHTVNEIKLMMPFNEVLNAETIIAGLDDEYLHE